MLEKETEEILSSLDREVEQVKMEIRAVRRRFVSPFVTSSGEVIGNYRPSVPSIPKFSLVNISDSDTDSDEDDELLENQDRLGCVKSFVTQVNQDINHLTEAAFGIYKEVHRMINRLL
jgi:hypothetical protein